MASAESGGGDGCYESSNTNLTKLHSSIAAATAKLVRWEVETVVNKTDREAQLQQVSGLIAQQNLIIPKLEQENAELRVEQAEAIRKKEDLDQKILHATREFEVLTSAIAEVVEEFQELKSDRSSSPTLSTYSEELDEVIKLIQNTKLIVSSAEEEAANNKARVEDKFKEERSKHEDEQAAMNIEIDEKKQELQNMRKKKAKTENLLKEQTIGIEEKKRQLMEKKQLIEKAEQDKCKLKVNFDAENEQLKSELNKAQTDLNLARAGKEALLGKFNETKESVRSMQTEIENLRKVKAQLSDSKTSIEDEILNLEDVTQDLRHKIDAKRATVEDLKSKILNDEKIESELKDLKEDMIAMKEDQKVFSQEALAVNRIEAQKIALMKENSNMKSRAQMLEEKKTNMEEELKAQEMKVAEVEQEILNGQLELDALKNENSKLEEKLQIESDARKINSETNSSYKESNLKISKQIEEFSGKITHQKELLTRLHSEECDVSQSLDKSLANIRTVEKSLKLLKDEETEIEVQIKNCSSEAESLAEKQREMQLILGENEKKFDVHRKESNEVKETNVSKAKELSEARDQLLKVEAEISKTESIIKKHDEEIKSLVQENSVLSSETVKLSNEKAELLTEQQNVVTQITEAKNKKTQLEVSRQNIENETKNAVKEESEMEKNIKEIDETSRNIKKEISDKKKELSNKQSDLQNLKRKHDREPTENELKVIETEKKIKELKVQLELRRCTLEESKTSLTIVEREKEDYVQQFKTKLENMTLAHQKEIVPLEIAKKNLEKQLLDLNQMIEEKKLEKQTEDAARRKSEEINKREVAILASKVTSLEKTLNDQHTLIEKLKRDVKSPVPVKSSVSSITETSAFKEPTSTGISSKIASKDRSIKPRMFGKRKLIEQQGISDTQAATSAELYEFDASQESQNSSVTPRTPMPKDRHRPVFETPKGRLFSALSSKKLQVKQTLPQPKLKKTLLALTSPAPKITMNDIPLPQLSQSSEVGEGKSGIMMISSPSDLEG